MKMLNITSLGSFHQNLDGAIGQFQQLQNVGQGSDPIEILVARIIGFRFLLGDQQNLSAIPHRVVQCQNRFLPAYKERNHHVRINHNIPQWQNRYEFVELLNIGIVAIHLLGTPQVCHE